MTSAWSVGGMGDLLGLKDQLKPARALFVPEGGWSESEEEEVEEEVR